jgi:hypothetical protein
LLEQHLIAIACLGDVFSQRETQFGVNYVVDGELPTPAGRPLLVRTVWFVRSERTVPTFATLYPRPSRVSRDDT